MNNTSPITVLIKDSQNGRVEVFSGASGCVSFAHLPGTRALTNMFVSAKLPPRISNTSSRLSTNGSHSGRFLTTADDDDELDVELCALLLDDELLGCGVSQLSIAWRGGPYGVFLQASASPSPTSTPKPPQSVNG
jgi:hypothetical protein